MVTALGLAGGILVLISLRFIQTSYDVFGIKIFKIVWVSFMIIFSLDVGLVMMLDKISIYS